ncbi:MAG: hypothetical protein ACXWYT_08035 [Actinomycetota bacterium]
MRVNGLDYLCLKRKAGLLDGSTASMWTGVLDAEQAAFVGVGLACPSEPGWIGADELESFEDLPSPVEERIDRARDAKLLPVLEYVLSERTAAQVARRR